MPALTYAAQQAGEVITQQRLMTADELLLLSQSGEGKRHELVRGVLIERVATGDPHAIAVSRIDYALPRYAEINDYGETRAGEPGCRLEFAPDIVGAPDIAWIASRRIPEGTQDFPNLAPDLVVEVVSPGPALTEEAGMWLSFGSREVWYGDPEHAAHPLPPGPRTEGFGRG
jgi:Uma2 family endonuclease